ncbi:uncharacterized protein LOC143197990 isoform X1 [Rhynchophorus ferrugineus]|uniref:uncharacterized protein LOC143197990 isoform X1 n=1 Tax=Rhynchophorus ferrugineus TaxID=354439 RepID=UPI003FCECF9A
MSQRDLFTSLSNLVKSKSEVVTNEPSDSQIIDVASEKPTDDELKTDFFEKFVPEPKSYGSIEGMREIEEDGDGEKVSSMQELIPDQEAIETTQKLTDQPEKDLSADVEDDKVSTEEYNIQAPISEKRKSTSYDILGASRIKASEADIEAFFDLAPGDNQPLFKEFEESVAEEEEQSIPEEEVSQLDRDPYYERYDVITECILVNKIKNNILHKKISMLFKRRRVEYFLKDIEPPLDLVNKYNQKLEAYGEMIQINKSEREAIAEELEVLRKKRDEKRVVVEKMFGGLQTKEELGYGLILAKTGSVISSKLVDRLLKRQRTQMNQVSTMRLKYLQLKEMLQEKFDQMEVINRIGSKFHLVDYEELKSDNRSYADKIEEREEELTRLRTKCQNTIQILAHMREKSAALDWDFYDLRNEVDRLEMMYMDTRQYLNETKKKKDHFRQAFDKEMKECGLLSEPDLLYDMEMVQRQCQKDQEQLDACIEEVQLKTVQVRNLRKKQTQLSHEVHKKKDARRLSSLTEKSSKSLRTAAQPPELYFYKGRASLCMPVIDQDMFKDLITVKPNPRVTNRGKYNFCKKANKS